MAFKRDDKKQEAWRDLIGRQGASGMGIGAFCRQHGLSQSSFYWWRGELQRRGVLAEGSPTFVAATAQSAARVGKNRADEGSGATGSVKGLDDPVGAVLDSAKTAAGEGDSVFVEVARGDRRASPSAESLSSGRRPPTGVASAIPGQPSRRRPSEHRSPAESAQPDPPAIEVIVGDGRRLLVHSGFDEVTLLRVVRALEQAPQNESPLTVGGSDRRSWRFPDRRHAATADSPGTESREPGGLQRTGGQRC